MEEIVGSILIFGLFAIAIVALYILPTVLEYRLEVKRGERGKNENKLYKVKFRRPADFGSDAVALIMLIEAKDSTEACRKALKVEQARGGLWLFDTIERFDCNEKEEVRREVLEEELIKKRFKKSCLTTDWHDSCNILYVTPKD